MQGLLQSVIERPCPCPLAFRSPLSSRHHDHLNHSLIISFPLETTFSFIKNKGRFLHVSAISTSLDNSSHSHDFLHNLQHPTKKRGPGCLKASKGGLFNLRPYPRMTKKPEWWWRTLACLPYLMTFYDHQYWTQAHPTNNPPPFLENFDSLTFPLLSAIYAMPRVFLSCYAFLSWLSIVRQKFWPHFLRFHVITAVLIGSILEVIGIASGWFPSWFFPPHFWSAATFVYLVTVLQCIICALSGKYADVPFVKDAASLHADPR